MRLLKLRTWAADIRDASTGMRRTTAGTLVSILDVLPRVQARNLRNQLWLTVGELRLRLIDN